MCHVSDIGLIFSNIVMYCHVVNIFMGGLRENVERQCDIY